jgi:mono/diheme cytochrome c family protein
MKSKSIARVLIPVIAGPMLLISATAHAQDAPSDCVVGGALAYDNWTKEDAGGTGSLPESVQSSDYIRCKACHGWDHMGTDGGYVRRSRRESRPNAGAGDGDSTSRNISFAARGEDTTVTVEMIRHEGTGRAYGDGQGSWVALDETHSAANKAAHANGYTLGNQHPDFSTGDLTQVQAECLAEFLNFEDADPSVYFADINPDLNPVQYTIIGTADADAGEAYYADNCNACHGDPAGESPIGAPDGGILAYLAEDGKFSEFSHKVRWGIPDTGMTRGAMGDPTAQDVADMMLYLQEAGGTGFALNPGLTGTWWGGPERDGEGFLLEFGYSIDSLTLFASFYTYDNMGNQAWLVAQPTGGVLPESGTDVPVDLYMVTGPMWGADFDPADRVNTLWGTGTFSFDSCWSGAVTLTPGEDAQGMGYTELSYALQRDLIVPGNLCPTPASN